MRQHYLGNGGYIGAYHSSFNYSRPMDSPLGSSLAEVDSPAECLLLVEYRGNGRPQGDVYSTSSAGGMNFQNHLGTTNFLFADGHVKAMRPNQTVAGGRNMWANDPNAAVATGLRDTLNAQTAAMMQ
jgi:prepilin-type processing-associated H-X9-DG protein